MKIGDDEDKQLSTDNFVIPFKQNPMFTGRREFLKILKEKLFDQAPQKHSHCVALYGMGGIGKTQIALEYVYTNRDSYDKIYWISAVDQTSLLSGYQKIVIKAGLKALLHLKPVEAAEDLLHWLSQERSWLIVIDNLDDIDVVTGFLPQNGPNKHTLITSRNPNAGGIPAEGLEVPLLDPADSINLLSILSNIDIVVNSSESAQAALIVHELGYLPLAIEQAAAYVREVAGKFDTFLDDYHKSHNDVHQWISQGYRPYPHSIATTWLMSFNIVRKSNPQAAELFQILSFLNPDGVLIDFLESGIKAFHDDLREVVSSQINRSKALIELEKCSMLKWNRQTRTLAIHRLMQAAIRDEMSEEERAIVVPTVLNICDESFPKEWNNDTRAPCRVYFGQVIIPLLLTTKYVHTRKSADIMARIADFLGRDGKHNDSAKLLREVVEIRTTLDGTAGLSTLSGMNDLALAYGQQGKLTEAVKIHEEVLEKRQVILGDYHPDTLTSMHNLAETYRQQGKLTEASEIHEEVWRKRKMILGDEHFDMLTSMHNLAETYRQRGKLTKAAEMHEEVLVKCRAIWGDNHLNTLTSVHNLAETYRQLGKLTEAAKMHEEELEKCKMILGDEHPDTLVSRQNLAETYRQQGKLTEAAKMHKEVLTKKEMILGNNHPSILTSMHNLALTYQQQGKLTEAVKMFEEVLTKREMILGDDHPDTLISMHNLAEMYRQQGKLRETAKMHQEMLPKFRAILGDNHPSTLACMHNLAKTYRQQGKQVEAAKMHEEEMAKCKMILGDDHPDTLTSMYNLAETYRRQGKLTEAAKIHTIVLTKREVILGSDHPDTITSMQNLAVMYQQQGKLKEAAKIHRDVLAKKSAILGKDHPDTLTSMPDEVLARGEMILCDDHPDKFISVHNIAKMCRNLIIFLLAVIVAYLLSCHKVLAVVKILSMSKLVLVYK